MLYRVLEKLLIVLLATVGGLAGGFIASSLDLNVEKLAAVVGIISAAFGGAVYLLQRFESEREKRAAEQAESERHGIETFLTVRGIADVFEIANAFRWTPEHAQDRVSELLAAKRIVHVPMGGAHHAKYSLPGSPFAPQGPSGYPL